LEKGDTAPAHAPDPSPRNIEEADDSVAEGLDPR
jgi:hypothetical protein